MKVGEYSTLKFLVLVFLAAGFAYLFFSAANKIVHNKRLQGKWGGIDGLGAKKQEAAAPSVAAGTASAAAPSIAATSQAAMKFSPMMAN